jgi:hypothetical protein
MKNMNENVTMVQSVKAKVAQFVSDAMETQGDMGIRGSGLLMLSEPVIPAQLLRETSE